MQSKTIFWDHKLFQGVRGPTDMWGTEGGQQKTQLSRKTRIWCLTDRRKVGQCPWQSQLAENDVTRWVGEGWDLRWGSGDTLHTRLCDRERGCAGPLSDSLCRLVGEMVEAEVPLWPSCSLPLSPVCWRQRYHERDGGKTGLPKLSFG